MNLNKIYKSLLFCLNLFIIIFGIFVCFTGYLTMPKLMIIIVTLAISLFVSCLSIKKSNKVEWILRDCILVASVLIFILIVAMVFFLNSKAYSFSQTNEAYSNIISTIYYFELILPASILTNVYTIFRIKSK